MVCAILQVYGDNLQQFHKRRQETPTDDMCKKAQTPRELLVEQFFLPFFVTYLRDSKSDAISITATSSMAAVLQEMKVGVSLHGHYELNKMSRE